ncbi:MAG: hypothetical protein ACT4PG_12675 [Panacagrimonas sp.]
MRGLSLSLRWGLLAFGAWLSAGMIALPAQAQVQDGEVLAVVVPADAGVDVLDLAEVAQIFRRKKTLWPGGARIVPVNLPADHPLRIRFSRVVLQQSPRAMEDYWNQQYFQGVLPPHVLASEQAVQRFVAGTTHAIGYLPYCGLGASLRAALRIDAQGRVLRADESVKCPAPPP